MDEKRFRDLETDSALIKRDLSQFVTLLNKMDIAIEKVTDVSNKTNQLLAVHGSRLDENERRFEKCLDEVKSIVTKMESMNVYLIGEITSLDVKVRDELKAQRNSLDEDFEKEEEKLKELLKKQEDEIAKLNDKMNRLERWKFIVIGFSIAAGWILDKIPLAVGLGG